MKKIILLLILLMSSSQSAYCEDSSPDPLIGRHNFWSNFWSWDTTNKLIYDSYFIETDKTCSSTNYDTEKIFAGSGSIFYENDRSKSDKYKIVEFEHIVKDTTKKTVQKNKPYKLCADPGKMPKYNYKRTGGVTTGLLVVPFKLRDGGDLSGDATIGPYIGVSGEIFSIIATIGISQISTTDINTSDVKSETGLSGAVGLNWKVYDNFDIAFLVGSDHLSGSAADNFKYQDEAWYSFSIGYNFTR